MPASETKAAVQTKRLSVDDIDAKDDLPEITVPIPAWDGEVVIKGLSYDALQHARQQSFDPRKRETNEDMLNAWCLTLGLVEPKINVEKAKAWIMNKSFGPVNTILAEILTATGLGQRAADEAKSTPTD